MIQTAHTAIANARGKLEQRLARWLLMAHDRLDGDELPLTHEFLALMLGVRRAGVTESVANLESEGMIRARRGRITVKNRPSLEKRAAGFYGIPEAEHRRLITELTSTRRQHPGLEPANRSLEVTRRNEAACRRCRP